MKKIVVVLLFVVIMFAFVGCKGSKVSYNVGDKGPAGGFIFYDCDADNDSGNADGLISSECGWRYLEAAPEDLSDSYQFGCYRASDTDTESIVGTDTAIGKGKANTENLVKAMGLGSGSRKENYAARVCADYSITVENVVYDDWFLPSKDELNLMLENLHEKNLGSFVKRVSYWSSSEYDSDNAWVQFFGSFSGLQDNCERYWVYRVRPIRAFSECTENINHSWNSGTETTPATCTSYGIMTYTCIICGQTRTDLKKKDHTYVNYKCSECGQWGKGPSGGYVFYDCDADNDSGNADGLVSSKCGWRYLEAAPSNISDEYYDYSFGFYRTSDTASNTRVGTATAIGKGKANTEKLVRAMGDSAYIDYEGSTKKIYAAKACADYSLSVDGVIYDDWFLPSIGELILMYERLYRDIFGSFDGGYYWSSSEYDSEDAWVQCFRDGDLYDTWWRSLGENVRPIRAFSECTESIDHSWNSGIETTPATCTSYGIMTYTCIICGQTRTDLIKKDHTYVNYRCSECGQWGKGPSGGYVFYDCDADNNVKYTDSETGEIKKNKDGLTSSECGWRYLEAAPEDLSDSYIFGLYTTGSDDLGSITIIGTDTAIGKGQANTEKLVKAMGKSAYSGFGNEKENYTAKACADYSITVDGVIYDDWFLPSKDELNLMYERLYKNNLVSFADDYYWSSSELSSYDAWEQYFVSGNQDSGSRYYSNYVRPIRAFK